MAAASRVDVRAHYEAIRRHDRSALVIVFGHEHFRVRATGRNWDWIQVHTVRGGAICRFREYTDTAAIVAAFA